MEPLLLNIYSWIYNLIQTNLLPLNTNNWNLINFSWHFVKIADMLLSLHCDARILTLYWSYLTLRPFDHILWLVNPLSLFGQAGRNLEIGNTIAPINFCQKYVKTPLWLNMKTRFLHQHINVKVVKQISNSFQFKNWIPLNSSSNTREIQSKGSLNKVSL